MTFPVGDKFDKKIPHDGAIFEIHNNLCQCVIGLSNISKKEIAAVDRGKITFDLCYVDGIIFLCANFSGIMFFEMPFNMKLYDEFQLSDPGTNGYLMPVFLVDNETNTIMAMRGLGFKNEFSKKLYGFSKEQRIMIQSLKEYILRIQDPNCLKTVKLKMYSEI